MAEENKTTTVPGSGPSTEGPKSQVDRERKSHVKKTEKKSGAKSAAKGSTRDSAQDKLQKSAADRLTDQAADARKRATAPNISTKLQTKEIVGKVAAEPHKPDEDEDRKVGRGDLGPGSDPEDTGKVSTVAQKTNGRVTDHVVIPPTGDTTIGGDHPKTEGQRTAEVLRNATSKKKSKASDDDE